MLKRVLEPEVMDTEQDASEYDAIDNDDVNHTFVTEALSLCPNPKRVIDLGTGPGQIPVRLAQLLPQATIVGIDLAERMLELARLKLAEARVDDRVSVIKRDVKATGFDPGSFDLVICNSLVHHMPDPVPLLREIARLARPDAALLVKDLLRPESELALERLLEVYAKHDSVYQRSMFAASLRAALTMEEVEAACAAAGLRDVRIERSSDRHYCVTRARG